MTQLTLPGFSRKRRDLAAEAAIPCATARTPQASHLTDDRDHEPNFDDLIAGNNRTPTHEDLLADDENDEDDENLKPTARELPIVYPGVAIDTMAWLREQDVDDQLAAVAARAAAWLRAQEAANKQLAAPVPNAPVNEQPEPRDEHTFDVDHLIPAGALLTLDPAAIDTADEPPATPIANQRLLFDALDALDRLPGLYAVDAASFEMAASIAAIQTYAALRPDVLSEHGFRMQAAPLAERLAEPMPEPANHTAQLAAAWTSIREAHARFAADGFVPNRRFDTTLKTPTFDDLIGALADATGEARAVFGAEAEATELLALEAGLPMTETPAPAATAELAEVTL